MKSKIEQNRYYVSHLFEMRNSFNSHIRFMTFEYHLKEPKSMCELKLKEIIARSPKITKCLNRDTLHPFIKKFSKIPFNSQKMILSTA